MKFKNFKVIFIKLKIELWNYFRSVFMFTDRHGKLKFSQGQLMLLDFTHPPTTAEYKVSIILSFSSLA